MKNKKKNLMDSLLYPSPDERGNDKLGYEPNWIIRLFRMFASVFIWVFKLNSNNRFVVEIQQKINPVVDVDIGNEQTLKFTAGHGRLVWRANTLFTEEPSIVKWINSFDKNEIFYDIGANVGTYSLYAAKKKQAIVFAFEPEINNAQLLYSNIYLNQLSNVCTPIVLACDSSSSIKPFYIREFTKGGAINGIERKSFQLEDDSKMFIQNTICIKLDDIIELFKLPLPTKLKIDVDGNELQVINGALKTLNSVNSVYIELFDELNEHNVAKQILIDNGFEITAREKIKATKKYENMANYIFTKKKM